jgi:hypothetical protein
VKTGRCCCRGNDDDDDKEEDEENERKKEDLFGAGVLVPLGPFSSSSSSSCSSSSSIFFSYGLRRAVGCFLFLFDGFVRVRIRCSQIPQSRKYKELFCIVVRLDG